MGNRYSKYNFVLSLFSVAKPYPPHGVKFDQKVSTNKSLEISWQAGYDGGASQTFTVTSCREGANEKCKVYSGIQDTRFNLTALDPYTWYSVSVTGVNDFGESDASPLARNSTARKCTYCPVFDFRSISNFLILPRGISANGCDCSYLAQPIRSLLFCQNKVLMFYIPQYICYYPATFVLLLCLNADL